VLPGAFSRFFVVKDDFVLAPVHEMAPLTAAANAAEVELRKLLISGTGGNMLAAAAADARAAVRSREGLSEKALVTAAVATARNEATDARASFVLCRKTSGGARAVPNSYSRRSAFATMPPSRR
jgi:hypothetical protein